MRPFPLHAPWLDCHPPTSQTPDTPPLNANTTQMTTFTSSPCSTARGLQQGINDFKSLPHCHVGLVCTATAMSCFVMVAIFCSIPLQVPAAPTPPYLPLSRVPPYPADGRHHHPPPPAATERRNPLSLPKKVSTNPSFPMAYHAISSLSRRILRLS